nr:hypothetical protein 3 [Desulfobulbaceae bacterium]
MINAIRGGYPAVKKVLKKHPKTRDCDIRLYWKFLVRNTSLVSKIGKDNARIVFETMQDIPPPASITRAKRLIQNDEKMFRGKRQQHRAELEEETRKEINELKEIQKGIRGLDEEAR